MTAAQFPIRKAYGTIFPAKNELRTMQIIEIMYRHRSIELQNDAY